MSAVVVLVLGSCGGESEKEAKQPDFSVKEVNYQAWHSGKFYYQEPKIGTFLINRTDSIQEEFIKNTGMIVEFDINWKNDSMYSLTFVKIAENPLDKSLADGAETLIKNCVITKVKAVSYVEMATSNLSSDTIYTTVFRH